MSKNTKKNANFIEYKPMNFNEEEMKERSETFFKTLNIRRSIRHFSLKAIPPGILENIIRTASSAPSGAHKQPWTFCVVTNPEIKQKIREAAEKEEYENYHGRMKQDWLEDLEPFDTDWHKPFLENAPALIIVFKRIYETVEGEIRNNYYVPESVGLACGFLLAAIHNAGLVSLTHTPSPMNFLASILHRPENERAFLLIPVGFPAAWAMVPDLKRKPLEEVMVKY